MTVSRQDFRDAMARLGAAVNIITTGGPAGRGGFTASAVCSVTDEPPTLLVCMNRNATAAPALKANGNVCVNVVAAGQQHADGHPAAGATRAVPGRLGAATPAEHQQQQSAHHGHPGQGTEQHGRHVAGHGRRGQARKQQRHDHEADAAQAAPPESGRKGGQPRRS